MSNHDHPYKDFEGTPLWSAVENAVKELVENGDVVAQTPRRYIVGCIAKRIAESRTGNGTLNQAAVKRITRNPVLVRRPTSNGVPAHS